MNKQGIVANLKDNQIHYPDEVYLKSISVSLKA